MELRVWMKTGCPNDCLSKQAPPLPLWMSVGAIECLKNRPEGHPIYIRGKFFWQYVKHLKHINNSKKHVFMSLGEHSWRPFNTKTDKSDLIDSCDRWLFCRVSSRTWSEVCVRERKQIHPVDIGKKICWCNWHLCIFLECHKHKDRLQIERDVARFATQEFCKTKTIYVS